MIGAFNMNFHKQFQISTSTSPALFKPPAGGWECDTCLIQNKADAAKCAACESPKPGIKPCATSTPAPSKAPTVSYFSNLPN